jgi:transposase
MCFYLIAVGGCGSLRRVPDTPGVRDDAAGLRAANAGLRALLAGREAEIAELRARMAELDGLRGLVAELQAQVAGLAAKAGQNSENSSRPPSPDGLAKPAPESLRKKTGRKPGRPKGQPGATMRLSDHPGHVARHEPACCGRCGTDLAGGAAEGYGTAAGNRDPAGEGRGHRAPADRAGMRRLRGTAKGRAPDGVAAPVQYGPRAAAPGVCLRHGQFLSRDRACAAMADMSGCTPPPGTLAAMAKKTAGAIAPAPDAIITALIESAVAHFDETGFRVAGRLAWVHSASSGKFVLVTVHARRGREGMEAAGVLPSFAGIACHDARKPCDGYADVAGHALGNAHLLRELAAVTETGTAGDVIWARQAIDALPELKQAADAAAAAGQDATGTEVLEKQGRWLRDAAAAGITLNAARRSTLQNKRHALATRMRDREGDRLRFAHDLRVPFDNSEAGQVIRMSKLRIRVSGCMRSMTGAGTFCVIRSYLATASRHGISWLDALTRAAGGRPRIPGTT